MLRTAAALFLSGAAALASDEETKPVDGAAVYRAHCAQCHGRNADAGAAGDIRGLGAATIVDAMTGFESMPKIRLTPDETAALLRFLDARP
jgi:mono/diheme cytochrome c family protein